MQKVLTRRKDELETQLQNARGTDFSNARTDIVSIGTIVRTTNSASGQKETFTILGAWDSDPDKGVVSYLTPVAQGLLNQKVGDEVDFEVHGAKHRHRDQHPSTFKAAPATRGGTAGGVLAGAISEIRSAEFIPRAAFFCSARGAPNSSRGGCAPLNKKRRNHFRGIAVLKSIRAQALPP